MHRWLITLLVVSVMGLCVAFLVLRWYQLAFRAPDDVERLSLAPVLAARADDALPVAKAKPKPEHEAQREAEPAASTASGKPASEAEPAARVNINTATARQLATLPGIGDVLAERIIAYRLSHGSFKSLDALTAVEGIGEGKLEKLKPYATAGR